MKADQERVKVLLTDTVTLLCRNGLHFQKQLRVQGVLGITVDDSDVFIVHINEAFNEQQHSAPPPRVEEQTGTVHYSLVYLNCQITVCLFYKTILYNSGDILSREFCLGSLEYER